MPDSYSTFFQIYFLGMLFNVGLPSLVGGDTIKAYLISRKAGKALHNGLASVLQDRAVGLISLLIYGSAAVLWVPLIWRGLPLWVLYGVVWVGIALFLFLDLERGLRIPPISYPRLTQSAPKRPGFAGEFPRFTDPCSRAGGQLESDRGHFFFQLRIGSLDSSAGFSCGWKSRGPRRFLGSISVDRGSHDASHQPRRSRHPRMGLRRGVGAAQVPADIALTIALATSALMVVADLMGIFFLPLLPAESRAKM